MKNLITAIMLISVTVIAKPCNSQVILTDTSSDIFRNGYELSGLAVRDNKFYFLSEKCKKMFVESLASPNYETWNINLNSLPLTDVELEGFCFYDEHVLFACDERNARVLSINMTENTAKEIQVENVSDWRRNTGMEGIAVDKERNKLFLLREKDGKGHSEIRVFNILKTPSNFSLDLTDTILISHSDNRSRYSDIAYNPQNKLLLLIRSQFYSDCDASNRYIIDTINTARILSNSGSNRMYHLNSESLVFKDISTVIDSLCDNYNTNLEGISFDSDNIYLVSDNALGNSCQGDKRSTKPALFIKIPIKNN